MGKESCILRDVHKYKAIVFTEGGREFGYGHITRCIALYDELADMDIKTLFVINGDEDVPKFIGNRDFVIDNWYKKTSTYLETRPYSIIDSYIASQNDYNLVAARSKKAMYIDDTNRLEYPGGIIVNPSIYGEKVLYNRKPKQTYLLGKDYIILRKEFRESFKRNPNERVENVLIMIGGTDIRNLTPKIIKGFLNQRDRNIALHVVVGSAYNCVEVEQYGKIDRVNIYSNLGAGELRRLMIKCDFAFTAAGQTIYELISTQTPFIPIMVVNNQENNIKSLLECNPKQIVLKHDDSDLLKSMSKALEVYSDVEYRKDNNHKYLDIVDGCGARRITDKLVKK